MADENDDSSVPPREGPPPADTWDDERGRIGDLASRFIRAGAEAVVSTSGRIRERGEEFKPREVLAGAAKVAATKDIRIYTIAIGDPAAVGEEALDIETLERVSELTGGQHFQALDQDQLRGAYEAIGELEPELYETISYRPRQSLHWVPVGLAVMLYLIYHSLAAWRSSRQQGSSRAA